MNSHGNRDDQQKERDNPVISAIFAILCAAIEGFPRDPKDPEEQENTNTEIAKWTKVVGVWTRCLVLVGVITLGVFSFQLLAFIESERGYLVAKRVDFVTGEPLDQSDGLSVRLLLRNVGKHTAIATKFKATAGIFVVHKELHKFPVYAHDVTGLVVIPPLLPDDDKVVFLRQSGQINNETDQPLKTKSQIVAGITDGSIPFRVWGLIDYETGYLSWRSGQLGFCFEYVPISRRFGDSFKTCDNPNYTYSH